MPNHLEISVYFNFRSPYCYLASTHMFDVIEKHDARLAWRPFGGWDGRSSPDRAKVKLPLTRQDVARFAKRMKISFVPPPVTTDPTLAGALSLVAEEENKLRSFVTTTMNAEWAEGQDIGKEDVLASIAGRVGLARDALGRAKTDTTLRDRLAENWLEAQTRGVIGVPTFVVGDQVFWGNDRLDFLDEHLTELAQSAK